MASLDDVVEILENILEELREVNSSTNYLAERVHEMYESVNSMDTTISGIHESLNDADFDEIKTRLKIVSERSTVSEYWLEKMCKAIEVK